MVAESAHRRWRLSIAQLLALTAIAGILAWAIASERPTSEKWLLAAGGAGWSLGFAWRRGLGKAGVFAGASGAVVAGAAAGAIVRLAPAAIIWTSALFGVFFLLVGFVWCVVAVSCRRYTTPIDRRFRPGEKRLLAAAALLLVVSAIAVGWLASQRPFTRPQCVAIHTIKIPFDGKKDMGTPISTVLSYDGRMVAHSWHLWPRTRIFDLRRREWMTLSDEIAGLPVAFSRDCRKLMAIGRDSPVISLIKIPELTRVAEYEWSRAWPSSDGRHLFILEERQPTAEEKRFRQYDLSRVDLDTGAQEIRGNWRIPIAWSIDGFTRDGRIALIQTFEEDYQRALWDLDRTRFAKRLNPYGMPGVKLELLKWQEHWRYEPQDWGKISFERNPAYTYHYSHPTYFDRESVSIRFGGSPRTRLRWPFQVYEDRLPHWLETMPFIGAGPPPASTDSSVAIFDSRYPDRPARIGTSVEADRAAHAAISGDGSTVVAVSNGQLSVWRLPESSP